MRKLSFVLLFILLIAFTGCQSKNTMDATVSSSAASQENVSGTSSTDAMHGNSVETSNNTSGETVQPPQSGTSTTLPDDSAGTSGVAAEKPASSTGVKPPPAEQTQPPQSSGETTSSRPATSVPPQSSTSPSTSTPSSSMPEQPAPEKSIYDFPFDIEKIKEEMAAIGVNEMGWRYRTHYNDGRLITPDNSSWSLTVTANQNIQGERLKQKLYELMTIFTDEFRASYGGAPIKAFSIYAEPRENGAYLFYLLY